MRPGLRVFSALLLLFAFCSLSVSAGEVELYVRYRPFAGALCLDGREIYVPLEAFLRAMDYSWTLREEGIHLEKKSGGGEPISAGAADLTFFTGKGSFTLKQKNYRGLGYVNLSEAPPC